MTSSTDQDDRRREFTYDAAGHLLSEKWVVS
jgi:YD repeat-containing protein